MGVALKDPSQIMLNIVGFNVEGFSKGTFITIERVDPAFTTRKSLKGKNKAFLHKHSNYTLDFTLDSGAAANTWVHALCKLQQTYGIVFPVPILFKDNLGDSTFFCQTGIIQEPQTSHGTENEQTRWSLVCPSSTNIIGGNEQSSLLGDILSGLNTVLSLSGVVGMDLSGLATQAKKYLSGFTWGN